jgi:hypothetical protein
MEGNKESHNAYKKYLQSKVSSGESIFCYHCGDKVKTFVPSLSTKLFATHLDKGTQLRTISLVVPMLNTDTCYLVV